MRTHWSRNRVSIVARPACCPLCLGWRRRPAARRRQHPGTEDGENSQHEAQFPQLQSKLYRNLPNSVHRNQNAIVFVYIILASLFSTEIKMSMSSENTYTERVATIAATTSSSAGGVRRRAPEDRGPRGWHLLPKSGRETRPPWPRLSLVATALPCLL